MSAEERAALAEIVEQLDRLKREAEAAGLSQIARRIQAAREEAQRALAAQDHPASERRPRRP